MNISMNQIDGNSIDLSVSEKFVKHYEEPNSFAKFIIDNEVNKGLWYDDVLFHLPGKSVVIDAGANVGLFSLYMLPRIGKVYCIEPSKAHCDTLADLFNKLAVSATIFNGALYNRNGPVNFEVKAENTTTNQVVAKQTGVEIQAKTLSRFIDDHKIPRLDLLKIDIEGGEQQVLMEDPTANEALKLCRVVFVETHTPPWGMADEKGIINKMKSLGFDVKMGGRTQQFYFTNKTPAQPGSL
jgi:FkbM family methyltransferase